MQDALSFRAAPQTHGAFRWQLGALEEALEVELNGQGDNPLTDLASGRMVSGGNFQPMQLALAFEALRVGLAHLGISSERRIAKLYPPQRRIRQQHLASAGDGAALEREELPGLLWYSAAGLLAELKALAAPATLGAPTLSADVEDHSTLAPLALQQLERSAEAAEKLFTIEALTAAYLLSRAGDGASARAGEDPGAAGPGERRLGAGAGAIHARLERVLAHGASVGLPAAALLDAARDALHSALADHAAGEEGHHDGEAHGRGAAAQ